MTDRDSNSHSSTGSIEEDLSTPSSPSTSTTLNTTADDVRYRNHRNSESNNAGYLQTPSGLDRNSLNKHSRPVSLTMDDLHEEYQYEKPQKTEFKENVKAKLKDKSRFNPRGVKKGIFKRIPILDWLGHYNIKANLIGDCVSGFTVAVMHIPQGMAYAMLASLDPICGIYMAFYPVLIYAFFGSSRHSSMGTFAVVCIMTGKVVLELSNLNDGETEAGVLKSNETEGYTPTEVACVLSFAVGMWMFIFAILQLGTLSVFLSDMLVSGFTTGAACHVFTSQVKYIFGITVGSYTGPFKVIKTWIDVFSELMYSNPAAVIISSLCLTVLILNNELLKPRVSKVSRIPIPIELIVVVLGTLASEWTDLTDRFNINIVGEIPTGLPPIAVPQFSLFSEVIVDALIIAIVSFTISYSMARIFGKKADYSVDASQEMIAISFGNIMGSFSASGPIAASLSRSLIQFNTGGKTQLTSLVSCAILLLVLLFIAPFFETLPLCVLASIILVALKGMFMQFEDVFKMLKVSIPDAMIWIVTFLSVVIIDIDYGLFIGVVASIILLLVRNQSPRIEVLGMIENSDIYLDKKRYPSVHVDPEIAILNISGNLHFANQESLRSGIVDTIKLDPKKVTKTRKKITKLREKYEDVSQKGENGNIHRNSKSFSQEIVEDGVVISRIIDEKPIEQVVDESFLDSADIFHMDSAKTVSLMEQKTALRLKIEKDCPKYLVLSLISVSNIDISACKNLKTLYEDFLEAGISISYACTSEKVFESILKSGIIGGVPRSSFFHDVSDAVISIKSFQSQPVDEKPNIKE